MSDSEEEIRKKLSDPFQLDELEWRVLRSGIKSDKKSMWCTVVCYLTSRAVQQRLDDVFGVDGWENVLKETECGKGFLCGLKLKFGDKWVTKWDGAERTSFEPLKGGISGAIKRAAVHVGIGRYLYHMDEFFPETRACAGRWDVLGGYKYGYNKKENFRFQWKVPALPSWALPHFEADNLFHKITNSGNEAELREAYTDAFRYSKSFGRDDLLENFNDLKDKMKEKLKIDLNKQNDAKHTAISVYLVSSINDMINTASNESVVTNTSKSISAKVIEMSRESEIDPTEFLKQLTQATQERLNVIRRN